MKHDVNNNQNNGNFNDSGNSGTYKGRYEAKSEPDKAYQESNQNKYNEEYAGEYAANYDGSYDDEFETEADSEVIRKKSSVKDAVIKTAAIILSFIIIILMILNMPIIAYNKSGKPVENISIITFIKRWQPLNVEGDLQPQVKDYNVNSEIVNDDFTDGLDLPQTIEGQYSILFLGFDEDGTRTDVNWIFQFDIAAAKINVLQIPRDTFMPYYTGSYTGKFNSIYGYGDSSKTSVQNVVDAVQESFGIPIDAYVTTHCYDIVDMVDLVGGIPITLDEQITYEADKIIPAGESVLNGQQAEWFVRYRHGFAEGDIGRVKNQRKFLAAAMEKMLHIYDDEGKIKFYSYLKDIYNNEYIHTDLSLEDIGMIADFASTISMDNVQVNMVSGEGADYYPPNGLDMQSVWSVHKQATIDMLNEYYRPYQHDLLPEESGLTELVTNYLSTGNDNTMDTLEDLQNGVKPGQNKTEPYTEAFTEEASDEYDEYGY